MSTTPPSATSAGPTPDQRTKKLKEKLAQLEKDKTQWLHLIKYWTELIAGCKRELVDPSTSENRRAELERWVQDCEGNIQDYKQLLVSTETKLASTAANLLHQDPSPPSDAATSPASDTKPYTDDEMYDISMANNGGTNVQCSDDVLMGVAGSGKTHSLAMALKQPLPDKRESTPCAKAPVRAITQAKIGVKGNMLMKCGHEQYMNMVGRTARLAAYSCPGHSHRVKMTKNSSTPKYMQKLEEEMIRRVKNQETPCELVCDFHWVRMTDSGGQPQFLELIPIFIHHITLGIITIKLNERLDHHPMVQYYKDGKPLGESYRSRYSHEQIIRHCMRALISQGQGKGGTKFLFLGTHHDLEKDSIGESLEDKNRKLKEIVTSFKMEDNVYYCNSASDLIFPINAKTPGDKDWEVMDQVRGVIAESSNVPPIQLPIKWYVLELALLRHVQETQQSVLLESHCLEMARSLHFDEPSCKAALRYLHRAKFIFYYEEGGLVVAEIQFILDKLSQIVCYNIKLLTNPKKWAGLHKKWIRFCSHGVLHTSCLDEFPDGYISGVFTPKELLQLFVHLSIISKVGPEEYLMPCLLEADEAACCNPESETQAVPAMALEFPEGGPLLGSYCGLVCYLMNAHGWKLEVDSTGKPHHLTRNSIHFSAPNDLPAKITINDPLSTFLLITFHEDPDTPSIASQVCPDIRDTILHGLEEVTKNFCYFPREMMSSKPNKPCVTFLCPCKATPPHPAIISKCRKYLKCPNQSLKKEVVNEKHRIWLRDVVSVTDGQPQVTDTSPSDSHFSLYVGSLPAAAQPYLDQQLDWDQEGVDRHLNTIAEGMIHWEEQLSTPLGLTDVHIHDLKMKHSEPVLLRRAVLKGWKGQQGLRATYRALLKACCEGGDHSTADTIYKLLREKVQEDAVKAGAGKSTTTTTTTTHSGSTPPSHPDLLETKPRLLVLCKEFQVLNKRWREAGELLEISEEDLKAVESQPSHTPADCMRSMLKVWLSRTAPPPTWKAILEVVEFMEPELAKTLKQKDLA